MRLGVDIAGDREKSRKRVTERGENIAGRLRVAAQARQAATNRLAASPEDADAKLNLEVAQLRVEREAENLHKTIALLTHLDEPTAAHQQLLIEATGEITPGIFDREVLRGLLSAWREEVSERIQTKGPAWVIRTLLFLLTLGVFALVAAVVRRFVGASVGSARLGLSMLLQRTLVNWSSRVVMLIGFMVALGQLGVQIGTLLAGLGIAGFIIGFALQDSLSNFAAGAMILGYRPFDMGDVIEAAGVQGVVSDMSLVTTTVRTYDNQTLILPNTKIWGDVIRILTDQKTRRVDLAYPIAFDADVERISGFMREILAEHDAVLPEPSPLVEVHSVGDSCLELVVRPWVQTEDYWPIRWSVNRAVVKRLREEGIHLQVPRRDIRTLSDDA
jgi:small conductance mechanosensitive channel